MTDQTVTDNIIPLNRFRDMPTDNPLRQIESYWSTLRAGGEVPSRSQVNPRDLAAILSHVFILEHRAPGVARFRVAGSLITQLAGIEVRGMPMSAFMRPPARAVLSSAIAACLTGPAVIQAPLHVRSLQPGRDLSGALILLPLRCDMGRVNRVLGAITTQGPILSDAYRLDLSAFDTRPLYEPMRATATLHKAAEPSEPFIAGPRLELVYSNDPS